MNENTEKKYKAFLGEKDYAGMNPTYFGPHGFIAENEEHAWSLFNIKDRSFYEIKLFPYSGKKIPGSRIKKVTAYR